MARTFSNAMYQRMPTHPMGSCLYIYLCHSTGSHVFNTDADGLVTLCCIWKLGGHFRSTLHFFLEGLA